MTKHTERRQQLRRADDGECLHIAARQVLAAGGTDFAFVDGRAVEVTARVLSGEEARRVIKKYGRRIMTEQQIELLADIQRLVFSGPGQTGCAMNHSCTIHPNGMVTSSVHVMSVDFERSEHITKATANQFAPDDSMSLAEQRDALAGWIAANRKEKAA